MSKPVLFVTGLGREIDRAENMKCLFDAYHGEKKFISMKDMNYNNELHSGKYGLVVVDIFPTEHPVKTVMMWHCIQGGKYIGLDEKNTYYRESYARFMDYIIAAGHGGIDMFNICSSLPHLVRHNRAWQSAISTGSKRTFLRCLTSFSIDNPIL